MQSLQTGAHVKVKRQWQRSDADSVSCCDGIFDFTYHGHVHVYVWYTKHAYLHSQTCSSCRVLAVNAQMQQTPDVVQVDICIKIGFSAHEQKLLQVH